MKKNDKHLSSVLDDYLGPKAPREDNGEEEMDCSSGVCVIKNDRSIKERINKKIIIEDGRQLLI